MKEKKGILESKLKKYYEDLDVIKYRSFLTEGIENYRGDKFNKILDIGAGIGVLEDALKPFGFDVHVLEASEYGLKKLKEKGLKVNEFLLENKKPLPFNNCEFSLVVFNQVIEHLDKETGKYYIKEILRVLEAGGVAIIKSPSKNCRIWKTDPNHIYCWEPSELEEEIKQNSKFIKSYNMQRAVLEPWMFLSYNDEVINKWHKNIKFPKIKKIFQICIRILDKLLYKITGSNSLLAVSNITLIKDKY